MSEYDVVIGGGGIAALTAGLFSVRLGRRTLVLAGHAPGGLLLSIDSIEGVPGHPDGVPGYELCPTAQEQAADSGAEFSMAEIEGVEPANGRWKVTGSEGEVEAGAVILATGARFKALGIPGAERAVHCASCDAPLLRDRVVGVIGGGDSALQEALTLAESAERVIVLHRGAELTAQETYQRRVAAHQNIEIRYRTVVDEILGEDTVAGVRYRTPSEEIPGDDATAGAPAADGELELAAVFAYIGLQPNTELLHGRLELDADGRIPTDAQMQTALPGLFAAGVLRRDAAGQAAGSAGDGAAAAKAAHRYLTNGGSHG
jgi:thioredoxin reductase (NADPH)